MYQEQALGRALTGTGQPVDFSGVWINQYQSELTLTQVDDKLSGKYKSKKSANGNDATGTLQGYVDGDLISFVVHWDQFQAITAWVGQLDPITTTETINTLWQMTKQVANGDEWASINAGSDYFTRKP